jgi:hypothetical protein
MHNISERFANQASSRWPYKPIQSRESEKMFDLPICLQDRCDPAVFHPATETSLTIESKNEMKIMQHIRQKVFY